MPSIAVPLLHQPLFAALAVVSAGRPLSAAQRVGFIEAAKGAGLTQAELGELERAADEGLLPAAGLRRALGAGERQEPEERRWEALAALTLFALRAAGDLREPLAVSEAFARQARLPHDAVAQLAARLQPLAEALAAEDLAAQLAAYMAPGEAEGAIARHVAERLTRPARPKRSAARIPLSAFQVEGDRQGQRLLSDMAGFEDLSRLAFEHGFEKAMRLHNLSSCIRVGPNQFPELHALFEACAARAGVQPAPELYVRPGGINAHTSGLERPYVMIDAGAVSRLSEAELEFLIGHELGHVRCRHLLHWFIVTALPLIAQALPLVGPLLSIGLQAALGEWQRQAELSCDRMGLLVCQDLDAALRVMVKWSGVPDGYAGQLDLDAFLAQAEEFRALDRDALSLVYKFFMTIESSHPWTVERAALLKAWVDEGGYEAAFARAETPSLPLLPLAQLPAAEAAAPWPQALAALEAAWRGEGRDGLLAALACLGAEPEEARASAPTVLIGASEAVRAALGPGAELVVAPAFADGPASVWGTALPGAARVLVGLAAAQLLSAPERQLHLPQALALAPGAAFAWIVAGCEAFEAEADAREARERLERFLKRHGRSGDAVFWLGGAGCEAAALAEWLARPAAAPAWRARWSGLAALVGLEAPAEGGLDEASRRAAYEALLRQLHDLALAEATADLNARFAAAKRDLPQRLSALSEPGRRHEGLAALEACVPEAGRAGAGTYLAAFERGLLVSAPEGLRVLVAGFGSAGAGLGRTLADAPTGVWVTAERPAHLGLGALTAVATGMIVLGGPLMAALGGAALLGAQGLRGTVEEAHAGRLREDALARLDAWLDQAGARTVERLEAEAATLLAALTARLAAEPLLGREATPAQAAWARLERLAQARLDDDAEKGRI